MCPNISQNVSFDNNDITYYTDDIIPPLYSVDNDDMPPLIPIDDEGNDYDIYNNNEIPSPIAHYETLFHENFRYTFSTHYEESPEDDICEYVD